MAFRSVVRDSAVSRLVPEEAMRGRVVLLLASLTGVRDQLRRCKWSLAEEGATGG